MSSMPRTELAWWQALREAMPPQQFAAIIARVSTLLYGVDDADIRQSLIRAQAMEYVARLRCAIVRYRSA
jgi:hypothetical protein